MGSRDGDPGWRPRIESWDGKLGMRKKNGETGWRTWMKFLDRYRG